MSQVYLKKTQFNAAFMLKAAIRDHLQPVFLKKKNHSQYGGIAPFINAKKNSPSINIMFSGRPHFLRYALIIEGKMAL